jgi:TonB family protein
MRAVVLGMLLSTLAVSASPGGAAEPPRVTQARVSGAPWNVMSGGIAACDVTLDASGAVVKADMVQDVAPYGAQLRDDILSSWRFAPATEDGRPVGEHVLVLGLFRPPTLNIPAPTNPLYKTTRAPEGLPWPENVVVPPYPANAMGSGKVIMEADISSQGGVESARVLSPAGPFDSPALDTIRAWTFRPASKRNRPVGARVFLVFSFVGTLS